jgi:hypothetical protein
VTSDLVELLEPLRDGDSVFFLSAQVARMNVQTISAFRQSWWVFSLSLQTSFKACHIAGE